MLDSHVRELIPDAWPILEWLKMRQPSMQAFAKVLDAAQDGSTTLAMTRINYGEVIYTVLKERGWPEEKKTRVLQAFRALPVELVSVSDRSIDHAVELKSAYSISYADAFAAALAIDREAPFVTGDDELKALERDGLLELHWVGA